MKEENTVKIETYEEVLSPLLDPIFKALFTSEMPESREALKNFISAYIGRKVNEVSISTNEPAVSSLEDKQIRYDISCIFNDGQKCNVEMTVFPSLNENLRIEYYTSRLFVSQKTKGYSDWKDLKEAYQISIIVNNQIFEDESLVHTFEYYDRKNDVSLNGNTHIITVELNKLKNICEKNVETLSGTEIWAIFLRHVQNKEKRELVNKLIESDRGICMATQALLSISKDEEMQMKALSEEKRLRDYNMDKNSWINSGVERGRKEGIKVGIQRGLETGRREGIEVGMKKGIEKSRREIIEKMRAQGFSEEQIKSIIG